MKFEDKSQRLARRVLSLLNREEKTENIVIHVVRLIQAELGLECIGIRLNDGADYPYYFTRGFTSEFIEKENHLCAFDENGKLELDESGKAVLECMCGNVIRGNFDPSLPFFTSFGSFWTNSTSELLASTSEADRQSRTRNQCNKFGYESVALIPIRSGKEVYGLLQLNDQRDSRFDLDIIGFLEGLASTIGLLLSLKKRKDELAKEELKLGEEIRSARTVEN